MKLFEKLEYQPQVAWRTIKDVDPKQIEEWREESRRYGFLSNMIKLKTYKSYELPENKIIHLKWIKEAIWHEVKELVAVSTIPFMCILTDNNGILFDYLGTKELINRVSNHNIG